MPRSGCGFWATMLAIRNTATPFAKPMVLDVGSNRAHHMLALDRWRKIGASSSFIGFGCALSLWLSADEPAFAQAGSTGGTIGSTEKAAPGEEDAIRQNQRPVAKPSRPSTSIETSIARAHATAWCLNEKLPSGGSYRCGFATYEQCMAARSSNGDWCMQDPASGRR